MGRNKKIVTKISSVKKQVNSGGWMNSVSMMHEQFQAGMNFASAPISLSFLLFFLICNAEFDSNSSCLDRLNNFGINSLQKLQN